MLRPCLGPAIGTPCPLNALSRTSRCVRCAADWADGRDYAGHWPAIRVGQLMDEPDCRVCGAPATEVDHILRLRMGGTHDPSNLQSLCRACHQGKTNRETSLRL